MKKLLKTITFIFGIMFILNDNEQEIKQKTITEIEPEFDSLNKENVKEYVYTTCHQPEIVLKQIYYETGHLTSKICLSNNNLFGMKHPRQRKTFSLGDSLGYAKYSCWKKSIDDYALYQSERNLCSKTKKQYLKHLKDKYAEDKRYITVLSNISI